MQTQLQIWKLEDILESLPAGSKILRHTVTRLTAPGENYGSFLATVEVELQNGNLHLVGKMLPTNGYFQKMFNTSITLRNEVVYYKHILPMLKNFQKQNNQAPIKCFPKCYGARIGSNLQNEVDTTFVLLMENLKTAGYDMVDRTIGFDLATSKIILQDLAEFHAVSLAFRLRQPDEFKKQLDRFFTKYTTFELGDDWKMAKIRELSTILEEDENCAAEMPQLLRTFERNVDNLKLPKNSPIMQRDGFATIIHSDVWINNFMVKFENGKPVDSKILDLQTFQYGSPTRDLIPFLFICVQTEVFHENYDDLLERYHETFVKVLQSLMCSNDASYTRENLNKEIENEAKSMQLLSCLIMLYPTFANDNTAEEQENYSRSIEFSGKHKEKAIFITKEFIKRKWL